MKALRDEFYFEPRVIDSSGKLRWYGEVYTGNMLLLHTEETVYIMAVNFLSIRWTVTR